MVAKRLVIGQEFVDNFVRRANEERTVLRDHFRIGRGQVVPAYWFCIQ